MSLAARCPACGTVFRVVQDQLRVSEGWVRCGRCAEVFNAIETLVDLDTEAAAKPAPRAPRSERVLEDLARVSQSHELEATLPAREGLGAAPAATVDLDLERLSGVDRDDPLHLRETVDPCAVDRHHGIARLEAGLRRGAARRDAVDPRGGDLLAVQHENAGEDHDGENEIGDRTGGHDRRA